MVFISLLILSICSYVIFLILFSLSMYSIELLSHDYFEFFIKRFMDLHFLDLVSGDLLVSVCGIMFAWFSGICVALHGCLSGRRRNLFESLLGWEGTGLTDKTVPGIVFK